MGSRKYPISVREVVETLKNTYHDFDHYNLKDPLDELLFIILSTRTEEKSYRSSFRVLKQLFPTHDLIDGATTDEIVSAIARGGLSTLKAKTIRNLLDSIVERFGIPTLEPLRAMNDKEAETFLSGLPGIGKKIARCVLMYSFGRQVFPVDTHCWRISRRLGWVRPTQKDKRCGPRDMDRLQEKIPPELRFSLHVNMVSLGREICVAGTPKCASCPILKLCPKIKVSTGR
jgi:endonuclease III